WRPGERILSGLWPGLRPAAFACPDNHYPVLDAPRFPYLITTHRRIERLPAALCSLSALRGGLFHAGHLPA
ncbi:MAG TPA: hypothetical protein VLA19_33115, partial [Herpetosiphonaceae bacterium]|nr:hypothetical protein [Herpetosiphonaceae bacterium]